MTIVTNKFSTRKEGSSREGRNKSRFIYKIKKFINKIYTVRKEEINL